MWCHDLQGVTLALRAEEYFLRLPTFDGHSGEIREKSVWSKSMPRADLRHTPLGDGPPLGKILKGFLGDRVFTL